MEKNQIYVFFYFCYPRDATPVSPNCYQHTSRNGKTRIYSVNKEMKPDPEIQFFVILRNNILFFYVCKTSSIDHKASL